MAFLTEALSAAGRERTLPWLRPDGKSQVTIEYRDGHVSFVVLRIEGNQIVKVA